VKAGTIPQSELAKVERELRSVGNADFYYRTISEVAAVGCAANALVLVTVSGSPKGNRNAEPVKVRCYVDQKQR
jgi:hypothetical protein